MKIFGGTDTGMKRTNNQDNYRIRFFGDCDIEGDSIDRDNRSALCLVCDGMGGARGGAEASSIASDTFTSAVEAFADEYGLCSRTDGQTVMPDEATIGSALVSAAKEANRAVYEKSVSDPQFSGMGTTLVGAFVIGGFAYVVNVGDSRLYLIRSGEVHQVTHDHSYVQYLIDTGKMTEAEAQLSSVRNIITRAVGTDSDVDADIFTLAVEAGDRLLLCSDGLTNHVGADKFTDFMKTGADEAVSALINGANDAGGSDNITVVIAEI